MDFAALCLKYMVCNALLAAILVLWMRRYDSSGGLPMLLCAGGAGCVSIYLRTLLRYRMYRVSQDYLNAEAAGLPQPDAMQLFGCGAMVSAIRSVVVMVLLAPSALCLRQGAYTFSLSGRREWFLLMTGAAMCLLAGGLLFAAVLLLRFDCAEYLFFSGECPTIFAALEHSWLITEGEGGGLLLHLRLALCGVCLPALCRMNWAAALYQKYLDNSPPTELYFSLEQDAWGEQWIHLQSVASARQA